MRSDDVSLRDHLEQRFQSMDKAIEIQTKELARRLDELNHAHQRSVEEKAHFLPREIFDSTRAEWQTWRDEVNSTLDQAKGRAAILATVVSVGVGIVVLLINHFWK